MTSRDHPDPSIGAVLLAVAGASRGNEYPLSRDAATEVDSRFTVFWSDGVYLARTLGEKEILVGGELVTESILSPGDVIVTEAGEYRLRVPAPADARGRTIRAALIAALAVAAAVLAWPLLSPRKPATQAVRPPARLAPPRANAPAQIPAPPAVDDVVDRIGRARLRYALANEFESQSGLHLGFLFWAIEQWGQIEADVAGIDPPPDVVARARERRRAAEAELARRRALLKNTATIAYLREDLEASEAALEELMATAQEPYDPSYLWAREKLEVVRAKQAARGGSASSRGLTP